MKAPLTTDQYFQIMAILVPSITASENKTILELNCFKLAFSALSPNINTVEDFYNNIVPMLSSDVRNEIFKKYTSLEIPAHYFNQERVFHCHKKNEDFNPVVFTEEQIKSMGGFSSDQYLIKPVSKHNDHFPNSIHVSVDIMSAIDNIEELDLDWLKKLRWYKQHCLEFFKRKNALRYYKENYFRGLSRYMLNKNIQVIESHIKKLDTIIKNKE